MKYKHLKYVVFIYLSHDMVHVFTRDIKINLHVHIILEYIFYKVVIRNRL